MFYFFRKAIKAVGVLFGYLGFSNFIFFINPKDGGAWEDAYFLINAILQSSQVGIFLRCSGVLREIESIAVYRVKSRSIC